MNTKDMTQEQIRRAGIDALTRELGYVGMIRFLQQYDLGHGDYTKERYEWVDSLTPEEVMLWEQSAEMAFQVALVALIVWIVVSQTRRRR